MSHFQFSDSFEVFPKYLLNESTVNFSVFTYILLPSFIGKSNSITSSLTPFLYIGKNNLENSVSGMASVLFSRSTCLYLIDLQEQPLETFSSIYGNSRKHMMWHLISKGSSLDSVKFIDYSFNWEEKSSISTSYSPKN